MEKNSATVCKFLRAALGSSGRHHSSPYYQPPIVGELPGIALVLNRRRFKQFQATEEPTSPLCQVTTGLYCQPESPPHHRWALLGLSRLSRLCFRGAAVLVLNCRQINSTRPHSFKPTPRSCHLQVAMATRHSEPQAASRVEPAMAARRSARRPSASSRLPRCPPPRVSARLCAKSGAKRS